MANGLRIVLPILVACFCVVSTRFSHAEVELLSQRATPVGVGEMAPDFTLEDQNGNQVTLSSARKSSPVVLVFYRGYW